MKCPLMQRLRTDVDGEIFYQVADCLREECAWWFQDIQMCSIRELALETRYTQQRLANIADRESINVQFAK